MKNAQLIFILIALYLIVKSTATKAAPVASGSKYAPTGALAAELQESNRLLADRVNSFESRLAALESSPFE